MVKYEKISLFNVPKGSIIVHACNAQGVWGSGIAKEFKIRYPKAFNQYEMQCEINEKNIAGWAGWTTDIEAENHDVKWIVTSVNYGSKKDSKIQILINTTLAVENLLKRFPVGTIYSNKFNSGLFSVPWEETEIVLKEVLKHYPNITWVVCSQD